MSSWCPVISPYQVVHGVGLKAEGFQPQAERTRIVEGLTMLSNEGLELVYKYTTSMF